MFLSIMGMYEYDSELFNNLTVPEGVDIEAVINSIVLNCAELELLYQSVDMMKLAIGVWSKSEQRTWEKLYDTMTAEYNPIWNVDADIYNDVTSIDSVQGFNENKFSDAAKNVADSHQRRTGNIGVTATQDLIEKERNIADFSIIDYITQSFKLRFCLLVY